MKNKAVLKSNLTFDAGADFSLKEDVMYDIKQAKKWVEYDLNQIIPGHNPSDRIEKLVGELKSSASIVGQGSEGYDQIMQAYKLANNLKSELSAMHETYIKSAQAKFKIGIQQIMGSLNK